jgi:outer membrane protein assembly factor BamE (lipoprotein component of BamABCDE complex)
VGKAAFALVAAAALSACASVKDHRGYLVDAALLDSVLPGVDNQTSVERTLGRPTFISEYGRKDWYYVSTNTRQAAFGRPRAHEQLLVKVTFDDKGNGDETPTLGRERTFLQDLFGNIGTVGAGGAGAPGGQ